MNKNVCMYKSLGCDPGRQLDMLTMVYSAQWAPVFSSSSACVCICT